LVNKLRSVGDRARWISRATPWRVQDLGLAKGNRARVAGFEATCKVRGIGALELALEEPIELGVPRRFLTVLHAQRVRLQDGA